MSLWKRPSSACAARCCERREARRRRRARGSHGATGRTETARRKPDNSTMQPLLAPCEARSGGRAARLCSSRRQKGRPRDIGFVSAARAARAAAHRRPPSGFLSVRPAWPPCTSKEHRTPAALARAVHRIRARCSRARRRRACRWEDRRRSRTRSDFRRARDRRLSSRRTALRAARAAADCRKPSGSRPCVPRDPVPQRRSDARRWHALIVDPRAARAPAAGGRAGGRTGGDHEPDPISDRARDRRLSSRRTALRAARAAADCRKPSGSRRALT